MSIEPGVARILVNRLRDEFEARQAEGPVALLAPPLARAALRRLFERSIPRLQVVSSAELIPTAKLERLAAIDLKDRRAAIR